MRKLKNGAVVAVMSAAILAGGTLDARAQEDEGLHEIESPVAAGTLDDGADLLPLAGISMAEAIQAAQGAAAGAVGEVDLEYVGTRLVFNVDIGNEDVKVDAGDGQVIAVEADD
jgi:uncharacterized membrane protein YkoI